MPEAVQIRHELDETAAAVAVEFHDLRRSQRRGVEPDPFVSGKRESMLHVELQLIVTQGAQAVDGPFQLLHGRHLAARHVEHVAAPREIGRVVNPHQRNPARFRQQLPESEQSVVKPGVAGGRQQRLFRRRFEPVSLRRQGGIPHHGQQPGARARRAGRHLNRRKKTLRQQLRRTHRRLLQLESGLRRKDQPAAIRIAHTGTRIGNPARFGKNQHAAPPSSVVETSMGNYYIRAAPFRNPARPVFRKKNLHHPLEDVY